MTTPTEVAHALAVLQPGDHPTVHQLADALRAGERFEGTSLWPTIANTARPRFVAAKLIEREPCDGESAGSVYTMGRENFFVAATPLAAAVSDAIKSPNRRTELLAKLEGNRVAAAFMVFGQPLATIASLIISILALYVSLATG